MKQIVHRSTKYIINGREFKSLEEMPEADRKLFIDANNDGVPDVLTEVRHESTTVYSDGAVSDVRDPSSVAELRRVERPPIVDSYVESTDGSSRATDGWTVQVNLKWVLPVLALLAGAAVLWFILTR